MKTICVFAIHRTGTNYLGSVLKQWPALAALDEVFHAQQAYGVRPAQLRAIGASAGREFAGADDPDLVAWVRARPVETVEALRRVARRKEKAGLYFKVFLGQWTPPTEQVIARLAAVPGFLPVVLQRRPIDVYVSYRKAEAAGRYKQVDTTAAPVTLSADHYAHWAGQARAWYRQVTGALAAAGAAPLHATYEADVDQPPRALAAHWSRLLGVPAPEALDESLALPRQDRSARLEDKIANADAFFAGLRERGLWDESQRGFLAPPR